jgi:hypothetical protein
LIIDDQREESTLSHTQEPPNGKKATEVEDSNHKNGAGTKDQHHRGKNNIGSNLLSKETKEGCREDIGNEKNTENEVVLVSV